MSPPSPALRQLARCVACGSDRTHDGEQVKGFQLATCSDCGLSFTRNPDYNIKHYADAYSGQSAGTGRTSVDDGGDRYGGPMQRLALEAQALRLPPPRLGPAEREAVAWVRRVAPPGATLVDLGCGTGRFGRALLRHGYRPLGVDVSPLLVETLTRAGLPAVCGTATDFPWTEAADPFALSMFEVLEHLPEPRTILEAVHARFPRSWFIATVPSPFRTEVLLERRHEEGDCPPHHFLRWTSTALERCFQAVGYGRVEVVMPPPDGAEFLPGLGALGHRAKALLGRRAGPSAPTGGGAPVARPLRSTAALWTHHVYNATAELLGTPKARAAAEKGASSVSLFVVAHPS